MKSDVSELKNILLRAEVVGKKNWLHAVNILEKAIDDFPRERSIYLTLGDIYNRHRKFEQAIDSYQRALTIEPKDEHLFFIIGNCYLSLSDYRMALYYYDQVSNEFPELSYNKALAYAYNGEHELSVHYLKELIRMISDNLNIYYFLIEELLRLRKYADAIEFLDEIEKRFGEQRYQQILKGFVFSFRKIWLKSYVAFKKADEMLPLSSSDHLQSYAQAAWQIGQLDKAIIILKRGLEINPKLAVLHEDLIRVLLQKRDLTGAAIALKRAMRTLGNSNPLLIVLKDKLDRLQNEALNPDNNPDSDD
jgi:tetratricopeptide (TPR) repeat protein